MLKYYIIYNKIYLKIDIIYCSEKIVLNKFFVYCKYVNFKRC